MILSSTVRSSVFCDYKFIAKPFAVTKENRVSKTSQRILSGIYPFCRARDVFQFRFLQEEGRNGQKNIPPSEEDIKRR
jgi:hypothetical protein